MWVGLIIYANAGKLHLAMQRTHDLISLASRLRIGCTAEPHLRSELFEADCYRSFRSCCHAWISAEDEARMKTQKAEDTQHDIQHISCQSDKFIHATLHWESDGVTQTW